MTLFSRSLFLFFYLSLSLYLFLSIYLSLSSSPLQTQPSHAQKEIRSSGIFSKKQLPYLFQSRQNSQHKQANFHLKIRSITANPPCNPHIRVPDSGSRLSQPLLSDKIKSAKLIYNRFWKRVYVGAGALSLHASRREVTAYSKIVLLYCTQQKGTGQRLLHTVKPDIFEGANFRDFIKFYYFRGFNFRGSYDPYFTVHVYCLLKSKVQLSSP